VREKKGALCISLPNEKKKSRKKRRAKFK